MSLVKQVKVGNITNLSEARYCAGMGVDYLSFPASSIDAKTFKEITGWVSGPKFGIELDSNNPESVDSFSPDFFVKPVRSLTSNTENKNLVVQLEPKDLPLMWEKLVLHKSQILFLEISSPNFALLEQAMYEVKEDFKVFAKLQGKLEDYLKLPVDGLSLDGNSELRPGLKEYPIADVLEKLEIAD